MGSPLKLAPAVLYRHCDPAQFKFATTAELPDLDVAFGQERARNAVEFGIGIARQGYNLFVMGPAGAGKHTLVRNSLEQRGGIGTRGCSTGSTSTTSRSRTSRWRWRCRPAAAGSCARTCGSWSRNWVPRFPPRSRATNTARASSRSTPNSTQRQENGARRTRARRRRATTSACCARRPDFRSRRSRTAK